MKGALITTLAVGIFVAPIMPTAVSPQAESRKQDQKSAVLSPEELFKRLSSSVFVVQVFDSTSSLVATGSGVAIAPDQVVTNKHVVEDGVTFSIKQGDKTWPATIAYLDSDHDLCRLTAVGLKVPAVPVRFSSTLTVGERVYAIGAPKGLELTISEGLISGLRAFEQTRLVQTSAAISPGSSGGGLFDTEGRLVGITTFFVKDGQNLNFALPGEWVRALASHELSPEEKTRNASQAFQALSWFQLGSQMLDAHEYEKAVSAFQEVLRLKPDDADALAFLGSAYVHLGQHDQAMHALHGLQEAIRLRPKYVDAWFNLGFLYILLRQFDDAIPPLQEAIRLKPDEADAWFSLGAAYGGLGQQDQAMHAWQETIRLRPDDAQAWYGLGLLYSKQGNRSEVAQVYEKLKTLDQNIADRFLHSAVLPAGKDEK